MLLFSLLFLFFFTIFLLKWISTTSTVLKNLPPSPRKLPIIGNLHQIGLFPHRSLHSLSQKYGPLMLLHLTSVPLLIVSSANAAQEIMKTHDLVFSDRPKFMFANKLFYESKDVVFGSYGEHWRKMKSICVLQLLSTKRVLSFRDVREEETVLMIEKIKHFSSSSLVLNLSELFMSLMNDVVYRIVLGRKHGGEEWKRSFKEHMGELEKLLQTFNVGDYIPWLAWVNHFNGLYRRVKRVAKGLDDLLENVIEEDLNLREIERNGVDSVEGDRQPCFVDILLEIQRENMVGLPAPRDCIKAVILDVFFAAIDTTYTALEWAMTELLSHPRVLQELQNEVKERTKCKQFIIEDDLGEMQYLKSVIKETMRLHPPTPLLVPRQSTRDVQVMGFDIAAGTQVYVSAWAIGRDPSLWDEPEEFRPERFLDTSIDFRGHNFQLIPFGAGRRGCPGIQFAMTVIELALANLVHKFDFALPDGAKGGDSYMSEVVGLTVHKRSPLLAVVTPCSY